MEASFLRRFVPFGGDLGIVLVTPPRAVAFEPRAIETAERPYGRAADERRGVVQQTLGLARQRRVPGIADRDQHIAHEPRPADALDRAFRKQGAKTRIIEPGQFGELRRAQRRACRKPCFMSGLREFVPRAHRQAIVAAINAAADQRAQRARDWTLVLDREVGNAAPRVETIGSGKCRCRANIETGLTVTAMIAL